MGYAETEGAFRHPEGRRAVFVGDLVDRGPRSLDTLRLVRAMMAAGSALCVPGNHDMKFLKWLQGKQVQQTHGLDRTVAEFEALPGTDEEKKAYRDDLTKFLDGLISHFVLDDGQARRGARGHEGGVTGPGVRRGAAVRAVRRDDGRDRRVRPARAPRLGGGVPRVGDGRLRPHAGPRTGVAQSHGQRGYRLRLRRQPHGAALPRDGDGRASPPRGSTRSRSARCVPRRRAGRRSRSTTTSSTPTTCWASASSRPGCTRR